MRRNFCIGLLLAGITLAVYWPVGSYDYVRYDDALFFVEVPEVQSGLNWQSFAWAMTSVVVANWHPVTSLSFILTHELFGMDPGWEHLVNVGFHAANAVLLFLVLVRMTGRNSDGTVEAQLLSDEIPSPQPSLCLGGGGPGGRPPGKAARGDSRPTTGNCPTGEGTGPDHSIQETARRRLAPPEDEYLIRASSPRLLQAIPQDTTWQCALVAAVFALHPLRVESVAWISERKDVLCAFFMLLTLWAWTRYVRNGESKREEKTFNIQRSTFNIQRPTFNVQWGYWLALVFFALGLMSKAMVVTLPFLLLLLDLWPLGRIKISKLEIQKLKPLIVEKIPFFALSAVFCWLTYCIQRNYAAMVSWEKLGWTDRLGNAVASYLEYLEKLFWPSKLSVIYPYWMNAAPDWELWNIAMLLLAISVLCLCLLARKPYLAVGWFWYLGTAVPIIGLVQVGETAMADRYTYIPLIGPVIALVWLVAEKWQGERWQKTIRGICAAGLLIALVVTTHRQIRHWENTVSLFEQAIAATGANPSAQAGLGMALEHEGRISEAMVHYRIALALNPADTQISYNLGQLLIKRGHWPEAEDLFLNVLARNPNDFNSHLSLGIILPHFGREEEAVQRLEAALKINPDASEALNNLAWLLATSEEVKIRDGSHAIQLAERACKLTGYKKTALVGTLAAAYAEAGRFAEAIATAQKACKLAETKGEQNLLQKNQELLELYRAGKPYRDILRAP